ncbi:MAG: hypothetical protein Ta2G_02590 [Termitinemataceae bacterium]|nr:MAG: hypothetical protein Ta2G_02590 [Termitinemataceae bacterium]
MEKKIFFVSVFFLITVFLFAEPFCISNILQVAEIDRSNARQLWQPDWPLDIPCDAFYAEGASSITLSAGEAEYTVSYDAKGHLLRFPFLLNGTLVQVTCTRNKSGSVSSIALDTLDDTEIKIEFLEFDDDDRPTLARINANDTWSFASFNNAASIEIVTDESGLLQGTFVMRKYQEKITTIEYTSAEDDSTKIAIFFYDSFGNVSGIERKDSTDNTDNIEAYSAAFNKSGLIQWRRLGNIYRFRWDEKKHLVELRADENIFFYEYDFDKQGNWIERRELQQMESAGVLTTSSVTVTKRTIRYK